MGGIRGRPSMMLSAARPAEGRGLSPDGGAEGSARIGRAKAGWASASVAALLVLGIGTPGASAAPSCVPSGTNIVCSFTTVGTDSFTVPSGVTQVTLDAFGAQGGGFAPFSFGGLGGEGLATIAVAPGQTLQVNVGGAGGNRGSALPNGGANGGGTAGTSSGAGGGGASDLRTGSFTLAERVVVGGGGGGGGTFDGGAGGGTTGGTETRGGSAATAHGTGGTQSAGGTGGSLSGSPDGANGGPGTGGAGGAGSINAAGSGGGGGYFGGGGGAALSFVGSGGGGSGFGTTVNSGVRSGNGLVTITYVGGQLRVVKGLSPVSDPGKFNLQIDGATEAPSVGDGGNTGLQTVDPGTHSVGETAGTSTSLGDYTSATVCKDNDGAGATVASESGAGPLDVPVTSSAQIACTITNTRQTGQLRVVKNLAPAGDPGRFNLQIDGATRAASVGDGGNTGLQTVNTGTHTVGEAALAPASLADYTTGIVCRANDGAGGIVASGANSDPLDVPVPSNAQIACVVTNTLIPVATPTPDPLVPAPEITVTGLERDREAGTATLTVSANFAGNLSVAKTNKVKGFGPVTLTEPGSAELEIVPRNSAAERLVRTGRLSVNPQILFATDAGEIGIRHQFDLRQD